MDSGNNEVSLLAQEGKYEEIIGHPDTTQEQRAVALIKLGRFREALKICHNNTYEKGYCYYKLGKYKSALHTAGNKGGAAWTTLRSQILYKLERPVEALNELKKLKLKGPILVNYAASVGVASAENKIKDPTEYIKDIMERAKDENENIRGEVLYNLSFAYFPDKRTVLQRLKEIDTPDREHRELVKSQIYNIEGKHKEISPSILNKTNKAIHRYNAEGIQSSCLLENMKHFQRDIYYQNRIKQYAKTKDVPELSNLIDELKQKNMKPIIKFISKLSRKNALRLEKVLKQEGLLNKSLRKIILKK